MLIMYYYIYYHSRENEGTAMYIYLSLVAIDRQSV